ncbi:MAG TPA: DsbA family protein [bacterium]|nr:DsbA family protein [bacterium]HMW32598.1 DsbA family protein [bacterium]HMW36501.1 DsbA family protein [bacterium]HMY35189.1 DsbA family protein [bacterium]HMZ03925.1 DsbA family protein [bacterium]
MPSDKSGSVETIITDVEIIYIFDTLCGWCYGFGPVVQRLRENYSREIPFTIMSGGLAVGDRVKPIGYMSHYILDVMPRLETMTGVTFGKPYRDLVEQGQFVLDSLPPAVALAVCKKTKPEMAFDFASEVQSLHFMSGADTNQPDFYANVAKQFGLDGNKFILAINDPVWRETAQREFRDVHYLGIQGYPALVFRAGDQAYLIANGYTDFDALDLRLKSILRTVNT